MNTSARIALAAGAGALLAVAAPLSASAHVGVSPSTTGAGSYSVLTFSVPHGCEGSPTTAIAITIPEEVASVTPTVNPGWEVSATKDGQRVSQVVYTAHEPLPAELRDTFELSVRLPEGEQGDRILFPVLQSCVQGSADWADPSEDAELPAPSIVLSASTGGHDHDDGSADAGHGGEAEQEAHPADVLARSLGLGGLVVGAAGAVVALVALRRKAVS